ncbi:10253_t:CDS:1, partial [Rhizophagus irregularis]
WEAEAWIKRNEYKRGAEPGADGEPHDADVNTSGFAARWGTT